MSTKSYSTSNRFKRFACAVLFTFSLVSLTSHAAEDSLSQIANVERAANQLYQALSAKDAKKFASYLPEQGFSEINPDWEGARILTMEMFNRIFQSGASINLGISELKVQLLDTTHAVVTGYRVGTIAAPNSAPLASKLPLSMVWQFEGDGWKLKHVHLSKEK